MTEPEIDVDLTPDDATLDEMDQQQEAADAPPKMKSAQAAAGEPDDSPQQKAEAIEQEAKERLRNADGETHAEKASNAVEEAVESLQKNGQQLQQLEQQKQQAENRIERLEMTKDRVEEQPPDCTIMQTLAGGVSLEVPTDEYHKTDEDDEVYTRSDLCDEIDETVEALEGKIEKLEGQIGSLSESLEQTQMAAKELQKSSGYMEALEE